MHAGDEGNIGYPGDVGAPGLKGYEGAIGIQGDFSNKKCFRSLPLFNYILPLQVWREESVRKVNAVCKARQDRMVWMVDQASKESLVMQHPHRRVQRAAVSFLPVIRRTLNRQNVHRTRIKCGKAIHWQV